jgi:uncharacterized protein YbjT (DUF2867 family)
MRQVFVSGGTGYVGRALVARLVARDHKVRVLARPESERKVPAGAHTVRGNPLDASTFFQAVSAHDTYVQLTGVTHPAPWKEAQFRAVDLASCRASAQAARTAGVAHFVYVSVAQPAPVMRAYIRVRRECEVLLAEAGLTCTILRPWYVLGPGRRWPFILKPIYALAEAVPSTRALALRLGMVTLDQMVSALVWAIENRPAETRVMDVPWIRRLSG